MTQLICASTEGVIRSLLRGDLKGITTVSGCVQHATSRWAYRRGIAPDIQRQRWASHHDAVWPDGWLADVRETAASRDDSPAITAAASRAFESGIDSTGAYALSRTLPLALLAVYPGDPGEEAELVCRQTHDAAEAVAAVDIAVGLLVRLLRGDGAREALGPVRAEDEQRARLRANCLQILGSGRETGVDVTAGRTAAGSLLAAVGRLPEGEGEVSRAVEGLAQAGGSPAAVALLGALLGAWHGATALPPSSLASLDLAWVVDTLARDLVAQVLDKPGGVGGPVPAPDPGWWTRYPGW